MSSGVPRSGKSAILFPGLVPARHRNSTELLTGYAPAARMVRDIDGVLGYSLVEKYQNADVYDWEVYQNAHMITVLSLATARYGGDGGRGSAASADKVVCGQSFGGFAAAVWAGACDLTDLVVMLRQSVAVEAEFFRGQDVPLRCVFFTRLGADVREELMARATEQVGGWLEISVEQDRAVTAVSGTMDAVERLTELIRSHGGVVFYVMNRAEHCERMRPLVDLLDREVYSKVVFSDPDRVLIADDGSHLVSGSDVSADLTAGWSRALRTEDLYGSLATAGVDRIVTPATRGMFTRYGGGRFEIDPVLPGEILRPQS